MEYILNHEVAGEVVEIAERVTNVAKGQRIVTRAAASRLGKKAEIGFQLCP